jgi:NRAMP (natural resistance-associated macrophage protein)-like metal ion transporter
MAIKPKRKSSSRNTGAKPARSSSHRSEFDLTPEYEGPIWRQYLRAMGPGLVTGASDDDPSGIATYSQAGAQFGLALLWTAFVTFPLMAAVQEICDRTALATGTGLGELAERRFQRTGRSILGVLLIVLIVANGLNIAADLVAIGSGMNLLHAGPTWLWALLAGGIITSLLVLGSFARIALVFKVLCAPLLAYIVVAILVTHQWGQVLTHTLVPHIQFNKTYLALMIAVLGTTISPYLFFWQSAHRIEEMRDAPEGGERPLPLRRMSRRRAGKKERMSRLDVFTGMAFSNVVMFAIIVATAQTLHIHNITHIQSAAQAAKALRPFAGRFASAIFAFGFIGSGLLAVPVLAASGSVGMAGLLKKEWGFSRSIRQAPVFYGLLALGTVGGTAFSLLHVNPIKLLVFVAVINGVAAAPFLIVVMRVSSSQLLMGKSVNGPTANVLGWLTVAIMAAAAIALFATGGL